MAARISPSLFWLELMLPLASTMPARPVGLQVVEHVLQPGVVGVALRAGRHTPSAGRLPGCRATSR